MILRILGLFFLLLATACNSNETRKTENRITAGTTEWDSSYADAFINQILGSGTETIRGFSLGDSISKVKELENIEQFEETNGALGYTFETADFELVDVFYEHNAENILTAVHLDVYLNSDSSSKSMHNALTTYFTQKYGKPVVNLSQPTWNVNEGEQVFIKSIAAKLDHGLQIDFVKQ